MVAKRYGNGNGFQINSNTTLSVSLVGTIVLASVSMGTMWSQLASLQQQINSNAIANTTSILRIKEDIEHTDTRVTQAWQQLLPRGESGEYRKRVDEAIIRIDFDVQKIKDSIVSRAEHQGKWQAVDDEFKRINNRIDEIRKDLGSSYTLADKIKDLDKQLNDLRGMVSKPNPQP